MSARPRLPHERSVGMKWNYGYATRGAVTSLADLTPRHRQVLMLVAQGWLDRQIERQLGISHGTLRAHMAVLAEVLEIPKGYSMRVLLAKWYWKQVA